VRSAATGDDGLSCTQIGLFGVVVVVSLRCLWKKRSRRNNVLPEKKQMKRIGLVLDRFTHTAGISSLIRHHFLFLLFLNEKERDGFAAGYFHISTDPSIKFPWKLFVGPETKTKRQAPVPFRVAEWTAQ
jgi:hypothetical protein